MANHLTTIHPDRLNILDLLQRIPLFRGLGADAMKLTAATTQVRHLEKGATLFQEGDMPRCFFVIVIGQVKEAVRSTSGDEKIIEIIGPHRTVGETAVLLDQPYPFFAECLLDTMLLSVAKKTMFDLLESYPLFARTLLAGLSMRLHSLVNDIESYTLQTAEQRFVGYLIRNGDTAEHGAASIKVSLPATKLAIASRLGMSPETLSRILKVFAEAGLISVRGKQVSIPDPERLSRFAC